MAAPEFRSAVEAADRPALLAGLAEAWPARSGWTVGGLLRRCPDAEFSVSVPFGGKVKMALRDYVSYIYSQHDEEPLYIFDSDFLEAAPCLADDYSVPQVFEQDHLSHLGDKRPDFRWLVAGPARSGAGWHVDPSLTSAWNTLLVGRKRWAAYPPGRVPPGVRLSFDESGAMDAEEPSALRWFLEVYPGLPAEDRPLEWVQRPGETVFLPGGWWHTVLNLEMTVAVTQNFVSDFNLNRVIKYMATGDSANFLGDGAEPPHGLCFNSAGEDGPGKAGRGPGKRRRGFLNQRRLGPWLRRLVDSGPPPETRREVEQAIREHCDWDVWRAALSEVCRRLGRRPPLPDEAIPLWGGENAVFVIGGGSQHAERAGAEPAEAVVVKFFCRETLSASRSALATEAEAHETVGSAAGPGAAAGWRELSEAVPSLLGSGGSTGEVSGPWGPEGGEGRAVTLPFLATARKPGSPLSLSRQRLTADSWRSVAEFLGRNLAALHTIPVEGRRKFWLDVEDNALYSCDHPAGDPWEPWRPFLTFFELRREAIWDVLTESGMVPEELVPGLDGYLPQDFRRLVSGPRLLPAGQPQLLHGDPSGFNVLVSEPPPEGPPGAAAPTALVDFGDAGHGDPLYDIVTLHAALFRCDAGLLGAFAGAYLSAYRAIAAASGLAAPAAPWWLAGGARERGVGHAATCYLLLHKQELASAALRATGAAGGLEELEQRLWGPLGCDQPGV